MVGLGNRAKLEAEVERIKQRRTVEPQIHQDIPKVEPPKPDRVIKQCERCQADFSAIVIRHSDREYVLQKLCPPCGELHEAEIEAERKQERQKALAERWLDICPPLYRETDPTKLKMKALPEILNWENNPTGIGLTGTSGAGKTRAMFLLLHKLHSSGEKVVATTAKRFEHWCHMMFEKNDSARQNISAAHSTPVLFIDDIGKEKYTERVESEFYDLIEHRTSHLLPILWTANASGQQLVKMMGEDRGAPIVRRLREFSTIISV